MIDSIRNLFKLKKEKEEIKDRTIRDIRILFEQEDDYYKPIKTGNFWNNNYIKYESNGVHQYLKPISRIIALRN